MLNVLTVTTATGMRLRCGPENCYNSLYCALPNRVKSKLERCM